MARYAMALFAVAMTGCATSQTASGGFASDPAEWNQWPEGAHARADEAGSLAAALGATLIGLHSLTLAGPRAQGLPDDCTGVVRFAWQQLGVDLFDGYTMPGENGVSAMYRAATSHDAFHTDHPQPGDLVFFRETYDRNRDGVQNDGLTHVGLVESVLGDGSITFVHHISKGIVRGVLSLTEPLLYMARGHIVNDYLRPASKRAAAALTGELFVGFATPHPAPAAFAQRR